MRSFLRTTPFTLLAVSLAATAAGCSSSAAPTTSSSEDDLTAAPLTNFDLSTVAARKHDGMRPSERLRRAAQKTTAAAATALSPQLIDNGGPVLERAQVYAVFWGANVPQATQDGARDLLPDHRHER